MVAPYKNSRPFAWIGEIFGLKRGSVNISNVRKLRDQHGQSGGFFVVFFRSASFIWFKKLSAELVWVSPLESHKRRGFQISLSSLLLGWWSFEGMINTLLTLAHNFLGGFDLTKRILDPTTVDGWIYWETDDRNRVFQKKRFRLFLAMLVIMFLFVLPLLGIFVLSVLDKWLH
jgi:hypothetical protein